LRKEKGHYRHASTEGSFFRGRVSSSWHIASRGLFLVAKKVLPAMRKKGERSFFFSDNSKLLRGTKRKTGESLYYSIVMMRTPAQVL
jgi:hypothetical protein